MISFKPTIIKDHQRADKSWAVMIRVTYKRKARYIKTSMSVSKKDLTASMKIKNPQILDRCEDLIKEYKNRMYALNLELNDYDVDMVTESITSNKNESICFTDFANKWIEQHRKLKGIKNYQTAINSFHMFMGREIIFCTDVTAQTMTKYANYISDKKRAQSMYTKAIARIFNEARNFYNDEENDIIRIKHTLNKFKPIRQNVADKHYLTMEEIKTICALPYKEGMILRNLAKDCFMLSFCLMGMNSADIYSVTEYDGEYLTYNRTKTKDRRSDNAKMVVKVHPIITDLFDKYKGTDGYVFNFHARYCTANQFSRQLNKGLKVIGEEVGIPNLTFYAARRAMASIAYNDVRIDKWRVNEMLCHLDEAMKVTDLYIKKDFAPINDANYKLIEYVFGDTALFDSVRKEISSQ